MKKLFTLCLMLFLFSPLFFINFAHAEEVKLVSNIESGCWTNEDVFISFEGNVDRAFYSLDNVFWQLMTNKSIIFEEEMQSKVYFKALDQDDNILLQTSFDVYIDKTPPGELLIFGLPTTFTTQDVEIVVTSDGAVEYSFFGEDFNSQNKYIVSQNLIFNVGDIKARDRAGNTISNSYPILIDKIDKKTPVFYVLTNTSSRKNSELVTFEMEPIISGIKSFYYTFNNNIVDITKEYKSGIHLSENGVYEFVLESNVGKIHKVSVEFKKLGTEINPWLKNLILIFCFLISLVFLVWGVVLHQKNKAKNQAIVDKLD